MNGIFYRGGDIADNTNSDLKVLTTATWRFCGIFFFIIYNKNNFPYCKYVVFCMKGHTMAYFEEIIIWTII